MVFSNQEIAEWKNILSDELKNKTEREIVDYLIHLEELDLNYLYTAKNLTTLPESIGKLRNLKKLDLGFNSIETLPDSIGQLHNLQELNLSQCWIYSLPESICQLENLQELYLCDCENLRTFPENIGQLHNLTCLHLGGEYGNHLTTLPEQIGKLKKLEFLSLNCEMISTLPEFICELENLQELDLFCYYGLTDLPKQMGKLKNLKILNIKYCADLTTLPESISELHLLEELNLYDCQNLIRLPKNIGNLQNLKQLDLIRCKNLHIFPESIKQLTHCQIDWDIDENAGGVYNKLWQYMAKNQQQEYCFSFDEISQLINISVQYDLVDYWVNAKNEFKKLYPDYPDMQIKFNNMGCVERVEDLKKEALNYGYKITDISIKKQTMSFEKINTINGITGYEFDLWLKQQQNK